MSYTCLHIFSTSISIYSDNGDFYDILQLVVILNFNKTSPNLDEVFDFRICAAFVQQYT